MKKVKQEIQNKVQKSRLKSQNFPMLQIYEKVDIFQNKFKFVQSLYNLRKKSKNVMRVNIYICIYKGNITF